MGSPCRRRYDNASILVELVSRVLTAYPHVFSNAQGVSVADYHSYVLILRKDYNATKSIVVSRIREQVEVPEAGKVRVGIRVGFGLPDFGL